MQGIYKSVLLMTFIFCHANSVPKVFRSKIRFQEDCECVHYSLCNNSTDPVNGGGLLGIRMDRRVKRSVHECKSNLEVCCEKSDITAIDNSEIDSAPLDVPPSNCGIRRFGGVSLRIMSKSNIETDFGEYPWMITVMLRTPEELDMYRCGGSLIHPKVVLTAAHCVIGKSANSIRIRAGEWDTQSIDELIPHQDRTVESAVIHVDFHRRALHNDFALLILHEPLEIGENVDTVCLPDTAYDYDATRCTATGWGKDANKNGKHQKILKSVNLAMISQSTCQDRLRHTILGKGFKLDDSFVCAGGVVNEDTCKGDGGSPLVCPLKKNPMQYIQVGIVSWGIGCGTNIPGVYANIFYARDWIDEQLSIRNLYNPGYQSHY